MAGASFVTLNVIVYQYGKVASTSLVATLNKFRHVTAYQCHFFGEAAFRSTVTRLCDPSTNDYFFNHSLGQLANNLKAYRLYHAQSASANARSAVLTVAREPFDWFRSSLIQEMDGHISGLALSVSDRQSETGNRERIVREGLALLIERIHSALDSVDGDIDALTLPKRRELDQVLPFVNAQDFEAFLFLLSRFLTPHWWFRTQFQKEFDIKIGEMEDLGEGLRVSQAARGAVYLARYEELETAFAKFLAVEGLSPKRLVRKNRGYKKKLSNLIHESLATERAVELKARSRSEMTQLLGYR